MAQAWGARPSVLLGLPPGSLESYQVDRDLALRLTEADAPAPEPTLDDVVDLIPAYDEADMPDFFSELPQGMG